MKILLDIDGVMIPARSWQSHELASDGFGMFSKAAVEGLNRIIESTSNPEIILTSSHKHRFSLDTWKNIFSERGVHVSSLSRLSTDSISMPRLNEIRNWYMLNQQDSFIVIDDEKRLNELDTDFKEDHLVLTNPTIGLNPLSTTEAIKKIRQQEHITY